MHLVILSKIAVTSRWQNAGSLSSHGGRGRGEGGGDGGGEGDGGGGDGECGSGGLGEGDSSGGVQMLQLSWQAKK